MTDVMEKPPLAAYGLTCDFGARRALDEVSFELTRGKIVTLIGPNGCGKSTLLKLVSGVLTGVRIEGQVRYRGLEFRKLAQLDRARHVCYVGADLAADFPLTALETVMVSKICKDTSAERVREVMEECRCWELRDRKLHELSGGERQRVQIAKAFAQGPNVLLLDEALSRMDLDHQAAIGATLRARAERGQAIILVSHDFNIASEWADEAMLMSRGHLLAHGTLESVLSEENLRKLYPDARLVVARGAGRGAPKVFFGVP